MKMKINRITYRTYQYTIGFLLLCSLTIGCHTVKIDKTSMQTATKTPIAPGIIGVHKDGILHSEFQAAAIPSYKKNILVNVRSNDFNQNTFNSYLKVSKENLLGLNYVDSLESKPQFITVDVLDRVAIIAELEATYNSQTLAYLKGQKKAAIVTSVSLTLEAQLIEEIKNAEAVFLSNAPYKQYQLSLVNKGKTYKTIDFSKAHIFAYELSFFCWGENSRKQIALAGIIDKKTSCPKSTYRSAEKATEKMNYFKL
ncbi:hypothetical protein ABW636_20305 [Aquimarina sp. 2201CG1-2-11]